MPGFLRKVGADVPKLRLDSWKSIADYLERSARTVQRWHTYHGLPVHHFGGPKGPVFAYAEEIDRWLISLSEQTGFEAGIWEDGRQADKKQSRELTERAREMSETSSADNLVAVAGLYRKAIDKDPDNIHAFVGLADTMIFSALAGVMDCSVAYPCAIEASRRALLIDRDDMGAKCSSAWLNVVCQRRWPQARLAFEQVLSRQPDCSFALSGLALLHIAEGDPRGASHCLWSAWKQNPLVSSFGALVCWSQYLQGDFEHALELVEQLRASGSCGAMIGAVEALSLIQARPIAESLDRLEAIALKFPQSEALQGALGYAFAASTQRNRANEMLKESEQMSAHKRRNNAYGLALVLIGLGRGKEAASWLETAFAEGSLWSLGLRSDPILRRLHGEPAYDLLQQKLGAQAGSGPKAGYFFEPAATTTPIDQGRRIVRNISAV
jgi:hypothetical protein